MNRNTLIVPLLAMCLLSATAPAVIINVSPGGSIQAAINQAVNGDEIVVAPGTYVENLNPSNKSITIRSSGGAAVTFIHPTGEANPLVRIEGAVTNLNIDGFTFENAGGANSQDIVRINIISSIVITIKNCVFRNNVGSSILISGGGNPHIANCVFKDNVSLPTGSGVGIHTGGGTPLIISCTFENNTANGSIQQGGGRGGGIYVPQFAAIVNCNFIGNAAGSFGGGVYVEFGADVSIKGCIFTGNHATLGGGGVFNDFLIGDIVNCTFVGNTAGIGGALFNDNFSFPTVSNCILRDNTPDQIFDASSLTTVLYSNIQGGWKGFGSHDNIDADPMFVDSANGNYHLLSGSPCIDAGQNSRVISDTMDLDNDGCVLERNPLDLDGNPRFANDPATVSTGCGIPAIVDMGAYEFQGTPTPQVLIGDTNGNGLVNIDDLVDVLNAFGFSGSCSNADTNGNGLVNIDDLVDVLNSFGGCL